MSFFKSRLRRLEGGFGCQECNDAPPRPYPVYAGEDPPERTRCPKCGRERVIVIRVLYEGEGGLT